MATPHTMRQPALRLQLQRTNGICGNTKDPFFTGTAFRKAMRSWTSEQHRVIAFFVEHYKTLRISRPYHDELSKEQRDLCHVIHNMSDWNAIKHEVAAAVARYGFLSYDTESTLMTKSSLRYVHISVATGITIVFDMVSWRPIHDDDPLSVLPDKIREWLVSPNIYILGCNLQQDADKSAVSITNVVDTDEVFKAMAKPHGDKPPIFDLGTSLRTGLGAQAHFTKGQNHKPMARGKYETLYGASAYRGRPWPNQRKYDWIYSWPVEEDRSMVPETLWYVFHDATCPVSLMYRTLVDSLVQGRFQFHSKKEDTIKSLFRRYARTWRKEKITCRQEEERKQAAEHEAAKKEDWEADARADAAKAKGKDPAKAMAGKKPIPVVTLDSETEQQQEEECAAGKAVKGKGGHKAVTPVIKSAALSAPSPRPSGSGIEVKREDTSTYDSEDESVTSENEGNPSKTSSETSTSSSESDSAMDVEQVRTSKHESKKMKGSIFPIWSSKRKRDVAYANSPVFGHRCCYCGEKDHSFKTREGKILCRQYSGGIECKYPYCLKPREHQTSCCPTLQRACLRCRLRGHGQEQACGDWDDNDRQEALQVFEAFADKGIHSCKRHKDPRFGFFKHVSSKRLFLPMSYQKLIAQGYKKAATIMSDLEGKVRSEEETKMSKRGGKRRRNRGSKESHAASQTQADKELRRRRAERRQEELGESYDATKVGKQTHGQYKIQADKELRRRRAERRQEELGESDEATHGQYKVALTQAQRRVNERREAERLRRKERRENEERREKVRCHKPGRHAHPRS